MSGPHLTRGKKTEFNNLIKNNFQKKNYQFVPIYENLVQVDKQGSFFNDEVHLLRSLSTLRNAIMEKVLTLSSLSPRIMSQSPSSFRRPVHPRRNRTKPSSSLVSKGSEHAGRLTSYGYRAKDFSNFTKFQTYNYMNNNCHNYDIRNIFYPYY